MTVAPEAAGPPLFLYGFARSGTTLLTMMLGAHGAVSLPLSVTGLWYRTVDTIDLAATVDRAAARRTAETIAKEDKLRRWNVAFDLDRVAAQVRPGHAEDFLAAFHGEAARAEGKARWANMDIGTIDRLEHVARWFPEARFVHIVRDARDIALSHQSMEFSEGNWLEIADFWSARVGTAERIGALLGAERHMTLRFEDLIRDTECELRRLTAFAGVDFDPAMLTYPDTVDERIPDGKRGLWPALDRPPQLDKVDRWRSRVNGPQLYVVQERAGSVLRALGYDCPAQQPLSAAGELFLSAQILGRGHRVGRLRRRLGMARTRALTRDG